MAIDCSITIHLIMSKHAYMIMCHDNEMDIYPIYPKMNLSKRRQQAKVCPYLLRNAVIDRPN